MKTFTYKSVGALSLQADVYGADTQGVARKPAIMWIHGGCLIIGNRSGIAPGQLDRYLEAGFIVVSIDYRLAPETKLPAIVEDLEDAFSWLRANGDDAFGIDTDRLGVVGRSAGGYLALLSGHRVRPAPQALVSFYGYGDIVGDWYSQPDQFYNTFDRISEADADRVIGKRELVDGTINPRRRDYYVWCRQNGLWPLKVGGHEPEARPDFFTQYCPLENVGADSRSFPPTLLLHGDADTDVPYAQSVQMARRLADAGVEHHLITISGGPHGFDHSPEMASDSQVSEAFDNVIAFLKKHV